MNTDNNSKEEKGNKNEEKHLTIFVNRKKKSEEDGVSNPLSVDAIARLVGLTRETAIVQEQQGESDIVGPPLSGDITIKNGMHFLVTRTKVEGGDE